MAIVNEKQIQAVKDTLHKELKQHFYVQDIDWAAKLIIGADTIDDGAVLALKYLDTVSAPSFKHMIDAIVKNDIRIAVAKTKAAVAAIV